ncbi:berberine bridge enzyme-like 8 [Mercurialis annua]|uniref:berberine bridge enzyme-like 8 n=1 Tax=Mercurialis annua TaxID=3986 RepID=UPI00215EFA23|nr:berberine bridge enzyme-like 8 [Mercurialis annua]
MHKILSTLRSILFHLSMATLDPVQEKTFLQCLATHSTPYLPIYESTYFPTNPKYNSILQSYIRNLRFNSSTTPKPLFIVAATHVSHIQASIICSKIHGIELRIRSGGHDYDGLSYVSTVPFIILDMFNMRSVSIDIGDESAWIESGATLGEVYYWIAKKSGIHGYPAGVCPSVGVGGHLSGGGYGNLMRKFGLSVDNVVDAVIVDANGRVLDREGMGEDLFWAIRGGGGASFCVVVSWKIRLVLVPEIVTVFRVEKTLEEAGFSDMVYKWQNVADKIDQDLFIRLVLNHVVRNGHNTIKAKFNALFLGSKERLIDLMNEKFSELGLGIKDCKEMSWIESVLFWTNYDPIVTSLDVLLERHSTEEKFLKRKSDYVQMPIEIQDLEGIWEKLIELKKVTLTLNPYGGKMSEISELETPFPHRSGNIYKIQYSVNWRDDSVEMEEHNLDIIRKMYDYMTPFVSKLPRCSYLNYRDVDLGINEIGNESYEEASKWGLKYFKGNFERLVEVKTKVDPTNFFRYEQSIPSLEASWKSGLMAEK